MRGILGAASIGFRHLCQKEFSGKASNNSILKNLSVAYKAAGGFEGIKSIFSTLAPTSFQRLSNGMHSGNYTSKLTDPKTMSGDQLSAAKNILEMNAPDKKQQKHLSQIQQEIDIRNNLSSNQKTPYQRNAVFDDGSVSPNTPANGRHTGGLDDPKGNYPSQGDKNSGYLN